MKRVNKKKGGKKMKAKHFREGKYIGFKKDCLHCGQEIVAMVETDSKDEFLKWYAEFNNQITCTHCGKPSPIKEEL